MEYYSRDPNRKYRTALKELVAKQPTPTSKPLPLTHVTDAIRLPSILREGKIAPRRCDVFGDMRLYAFYARPAYRSKKEGPLHNINFAPVCFIIDSSASKDCYPVAVYPFDTGALKEGRLHDTIHPDLTPFDFALEPKVDSAQRLVRIFFGDEQTYYSGDYRQAKSPKYRPDEADLVAYDSLVKRGGNLTRDERASSIEFQFKDALSLNGKTLAIILPQEFHDLREVSDFFCANKITALAYRFMPNHSVSELAGVFYTMAEDFYIRRKKRQGWDW
jgi:hypothetical protein